MIPLFRAGIVVAAALAVASLGRGEARAEDRAADPIGDETRAAIEKILDARQAERRHTSAFAEAGRALRDVRTRLRDVVRTTASTGGSEEVELVEAAVGRLRTALDKATQEVSADPAAAAELDAARERLDLLGDRAASIKEAEPRSLRAQLASDLLADLEASYPRGERTQAEPRRDPAWHFLPETTGEPGE